MKSAPTPRPSSPVVDPRAAPGARGAVRTPDRSFGADALKALAIIGVVFIHADGLFEADPWFHDAVADMFRFGVPVFVALYVHFAGRGIERRGAAAPGYVRRRFGRLLLQFVAWSALYAAVTADWPSLTPGKFVTRHWGGNGWAGQFYFLVILQLTLLLPWLVASGRWWGERRLWLLGGGLVFYAALALPAWTAAPLVPKLSDRPFVYWLPCAWLGVAWFGRTPSLDSRAVRAALAAAVLLIPLEHRLLAPPNVTNSPYLVPSVFLATVALLWLADDRARRAAPAPDHSPARPAWLTRAVSLLADNTLGIFVLNPLVILALQAHVGPRDPLHGPLAAVGLPLAAALAVLAIALGMTLLGKRTAMGRLLLG